MPKFDVEVVRKHIVRTTVEAETSCDAIVQAINDGGCEEIITVANAVMSRPLPDYPRNYDDAIRRAIATGDSGCSVVAAPQM